VLAAAAKGHRVALMAIGLDAIWIDMEHQSTDLAAGNGGDRHGRNGVGHRPSAPRLSGCKDCAAPRGAPLGSAARPDPCCRLGGGQCGGAHGVALAISEGLKVEFGLVSMGSMVQWWPCASQSLGLVKSRWVLCPRASALVSGANLPGGLVGWGGATSQRPEPCRGAPGLRD
jgi:hypothetical protein